MENNQNIQLPQSPQNVASTVETQQINSEALEKELVDKMEQTKTMLMKLAYKKDESERAIAELKKKITLTEEDIAFEKSLESATLEELNNYEIEIANRFKLINESYNKIMQTLNQI